MTYAIRNNKKDGKRYLVVFNEYGQLVGHYGSYELTKDEVEGGNECLSYADTVTTLKGNTVDIYLDIETEEYAWYISKRVGE